MTAGTLIAGGTTLVDLMKLGIEKPATLTDVIAEGRLPSSITATPDGLRIGALATMAQVAAHPAIAENFPAVAQSLLQAASPQIRNMATIGGNLLQRTRCPWFRDTSAACAKRDPGAGCAAIDGPQRGMAVLGRGTSCIAAYPGDLAVALVAHGATVRLCAIDGVERAIAVEELHRLPGDTPHLEHVLSDGERIVSVDLPENDWTHTRYTKLRDRASYAFALASVALCLRIDSDARIGAARLVIGGLAAKPWRSTAAEGMLIGHRITSDLAEAVAEVCFAQAEGDAGMIAVGKAAVRVALARCQAGRHVFEPGAGTLI